MHILGGVWGILRRVSCVDGGGLVHSSRCYE